MAKVAAALQTLRRACLEHQLLYSLSGKMASYFPSQVYPGIYSEAPLLHHVTCVSEVLLVFSWKVQALSSWPQIAHKETSVRIIFHWWFLEFIKVLCRIMLYFLEHFKGLWGFWGRTWGKIWKTSIVAKWPQCHCSAITKNHRILECTSRLLSCTGVFENFIPDLWFDKLFKHWWAFKHVSDSVDFSGAHCFAKWKA